MPDIYAVGDAVEVTHFVTGQKALISLAGPANKQGRIAADNICGGNSHFHGSQGSSVLKLFGLTAASTGINEKAAHAAEIAYDKVVLFPASHAAYYPGAQSMAMKVLYEKESLRLLGAQIVGGEGVNTDGAQQGAIPRGDGEGACLRDGHSGQLLDGCTDSMNGL